MTIDTHDERDSSPGRTATMNSDEHRPDAPLPATPVASEAAATHAADASAAPAPAPPARKRRGFAAMDPKLVSQISSKGGKAAHSAGTAHQFNSDEARVAGRKGGLATHARRGRSAGEAKSSSQE